MKPMLCLSILLLSVQDFSQEIERITVFAGVADRMDCSLGIRLDQIDTNQGQVRLVSQHKAVLDYQFKPMYPPEGINPLYKRAGFIHPLWTPWGHILTHVHPPDHCHHYGIWEAWIKTHIRGRDRISGTELWHKDCNLNYRLLVFDGSVSAEEAERYWQALDHPLLLDFHTSIQN